MTNRQWTLVGWWLFIVCAGFFIVASWRAGDLLSLIGSIAFMAANIAFLIPFYRAQSSEGSGYEDRED
jgi:hypothetical protein